jgi:hypothetical protein
MSGKKNMKSKQQTMVENSTESKVATPVVEPVAAAPAPVEAKQKGGRTKKAVETKVATPVVAAPVATSSEPVVEKKQRGGRKKPEAAQATESKVEAKVETKPRAPRAKASTVVSEAKTTNTAKPKVSRKKKSDTVVAAAEPTDAVEGDSNEKHIRSFKVKLPGSETFEGRFTGLTPYQAANKALSKYFREGERTDNDVTFSICESTRKSKKSVYTYVGKRHKLEVPVKYSIQDGREIVKNFKNTLKKVKKSENVALAPPTDTSVSMGASA